ncbi:hypothetical protein WJ542_01575 [Paraburkholderia sp. B3]|uniref:hypothetical protein n=1 Tax=Paraburkholderia TaxID=1822464 RepID=UPI0012ECAAA3|nr:hypothetical protein [Paraburkholderia acidipaludis]
MKSFAMAVGSGRLAGWRRSTMRETSGVRAATTNAKKAATVAAVTGAANVDVNDAHATCILTLATRPNGKRTNTDDWL